jgi:hypothetical protein
MCCAAVILGSMYCDEYDRLLRTQEATWGPEFSRRAPPSAGGTDAEETVRRQHEGEGDLKCRRDTAQGHGHQVQNKNDIAPKTTKQRMSW